MAECVSDRIYSIKTDASYVSETNENKENMNRLQKVKMKMKTEKTYIFFYFCLCMFIIQVPFIVHIKMSNTVNLHVVYMQSYELNPFWMGGIKMAKIKWWKINCAYKWNERPNKISIFVRNFFFSSVSVYFEIWWMNNIVVKDCSCMNIFILFVHTIIINVWKKDRSFTQLSIISPSLNSIIIYGIFVKMAPAKERMLCCH